MNTRHRPNIVIGQPGWTDRASVAIRHQMILCDEQASRRAKDAHPVVLHALRANVATDDDRQLAAVVEDFKRLGWKQSAPAGRAPRTRAATHPVAAKARALWISLHQLGAIDDQSERALEAFAKRQLKVERLAWADQSLGYRLIEALKAMAERHGWDQSTEGVKPAAKTITLKRRLVETLLTKLKAAGLAPIDWSTHRAAKAFGGIEGFSLHVAPESVLDMVAKCFARTLRDPVEHLR